MSDGGFCGMGPVWRSFVEEVFDMSEKVTLVVSRETASWIIDAAERVATGLEVEILNAGSNGSLFEMVNQPVINRMHSIMTMVEEALISADLREDDESNARETAENNLTAMLRDSVQRKLAAHVLLTAANGLLDDNDRAKITRGALTNLRDAISIHQPEEIWGPALMFVDALESYIPPATDGA